MRSSHCGPFTLLLVLLLVLAGVPGALVAQRVSAVQAPTASTGGAGRWQVALHDGSYVWELTRPMLRGDTLVGVQADTVVRVPLEAVDELRLLASSEKVIAHPDQGSFGALGGASDAVLALSRFAPAERRRIVAQALAEVSTAATAGRPPER